MTLAQILQMYGLPLLTAILGYLAAKRGGQGGGVPSLPTIPNTPANPDGPLPANHPFIAWLLQMLLKLGPVDLKPSIQATMNHAAGLAALEPKK